MFIFTVNKNRFVRTISIVRQGGDVPMPHFLQLVHELLISRAFNFSKTYRFTKANPLRDAVTLDVVTHLHAIISTVCDFVSHLHAIISTVCDFVSHSYLIIIIQIFVTHSSL